MDATVRPPRVKLPPPSYAELKRDGILLYIITYGREMVWMRESDRSTWYCRLLHPKSARYPVAVWEIIDRDVMDD